jgi:glutamate transport system permease protein
MSDPSASVLYDAPGPRGRRRIWIGSVIFAVLLVAGIYQFVYRPLDENGQFDWTLWAPLLDPSAEEFPLVWKRLAIGWKNTFIAAAMAIVASLALGIGLAILRFRLAQVARSAVPGSAGGRALYWVERVLGAISRVFVEVFRGLPVVLTIFFVARSLPEFGIDLSARYFLVIGLTLYNMVVIGEIVRSGMANLPRGQREAADAIGLSPLQTIRLILLPQALRTMLPALISQIVVVLKDTSLGFIISYEEVLRVAGQLIQVLRNPIQMYTVVGITYIIVNYLISRLAVYAQHRLARGRKTPPGAIIPAGESAVPPGGPGGEAVIAAPPNAPITTVPPAAAAGAAP